MNLPSHTISRRHLLQLGGVGAATLALGISAPETAIARTAQGSAEGLFGLGIASGAPGRDSAVLWTRLAPEPLAEDGHGGMPLHTGRSPPTRPSSTWFTRGTRWPSPTSLTRCIRRSPA
jgi:alkaline phosphatase D